MDADGRERALVAVREQVALACATLAAANARDEALARWVPPRRVLFFTRRASFVPLARAWRLGVFLLDRDGTLYEAGSSTRAVPPGYPGYQSVSAENRRAYRAAAHEGPFEPGETVNFDAVAVRIDETLADSAGRLFLRDGRALVRWSPAADDATAAEFAAYLDERVNLLLEPPAGA